MKSELRKGDFWSRIGRYSFCFYCGVDSKPLIVFFLTTLGLGVLGSVLIFAWSVLSGQWDNSEKAKFKVIEVEK